jgi:hypothetical protein
MWPARLHGWGRRYRGLPGYAAGRASYHTATRWRRKWRGWNVLAGASAAVTNGAIVTMGLRDRRGLAITPLRRRKNTNAKHHMVP